MNTRLILGMLLSMSLMAYADGIVVTAPVPAPNPTATNTLNTAANQNAGAGYAAGVNYFTGGAYQAAAQTAQDIANQDAANAGGFGDSYDSYAWIQAEQEANSVANEQQTSALAQTSLALQNQNTENNAYSNELNSIQGVQQANDTAVQSSASTGSTSTFNNITSQTGVPQGQVSMIQDTSYLLAGADEQALMNSFSVAGYQANIQAVQDAETAAECGAVPGCAAYWMAANAVQQSIADAEYAANVAAAPVLGLAMNSAALSTALSDSRQELQQIQSLTGVAQGQVSGITTATQALQQVQNLTNVTQGQASGMIDTGTSFTTAANGQQSTLNDISQQNQNDEWTADQAWQAGLNAQYAQQAAQTIANYDMRQAGMVGYGATAWTQAAAIAQSEATQQGTIHAAQLAIQTQANSDEASAYNSANALAPSIGTTLNTAAASAATSAAQTTLQQIGTTTGVPQ